jgi:hypothetical protein
MHEPEWLTDLRASRALIECGFEWCDTARAEDLTLQLRAGNPSMPDRDRPRSDAARASLRVVAEGPRFEIRAGTPKAFVAAWCLDERNPEQLWVSLSLDAPPRFAIPAGSTERSVARTAELLQRSDVESNADRTRSFACFAGLLADAPFGFYDLESWFATSPFTYPFPYRLGTAAPLGSEIPTPCTSPRTRPAS